MNDDSGRLSQNVEDDRQKPVWQQAVEYVTRKPLGAMLSGDPQYRGNVRMPQASDFRSLGQLLQPTDIPPNPPLP